MSSSLIDEWNEALPFQLSAAALQSPNEEFLLAAFRCLLQAMGINVAQMAKDCYEQDEQQHAFRIELCQYVNHLVKISNNKDFFAYFDLVCPTPKKTKYILKMLLNYYVFYHNAVYGRIVATATEAIAAYEAAQQETNQRQRRRMKQRYHLDEIQMRADDVEFTHVPAQQQLIAEGKRAQQRLAEQQQQLTQAQLDCLELEHAVQELRDQLVPEAERERLQAELAELDELCRELDAQEASELASNQLMAEQIEQLKANTAQCEALRQTHTVEYMTTAHTLEETITAAQRDLAAEQRTQAQLRAEIADARQANEREAKIVADLTGKQTHASRANATQRAEVRADQQAAEQRAATLDARLEAVERQLEQEEQNQQFIETHTRKLLQFIHEL